jgi:hypothetical protein
LGNYTFVCIASKALLRSSVLSSLPYLPARTPSGLLCWEEKPWLFNKSPEGAESSCGMYPLIETARQNGLKPLEYLWILFERCPLTKTSEDWEKLLPWNIFTA